MYVPRKIEQKINEALKQKKHFAAWGETNRQNNST